MIKFSIIVPIYKVENYLDECIKSVLEQTYSSLELILVDDGSPDRCPEICDYYRSKDPRVVVIHKINGGLPAARNSGIRIATGDYFMHLDGDDFWHRDYLSNIAPIIESSMNDVYLGNSRFDYINGQSTEHVLYNFTDISQISYEQLLTKFFSATNEYPSAAMHNVYKTDYVKTNSLYFSEDLTWSEDADNFYNVLFNTRNIGLLNFTFYYYRKDNMGAMTKAASVKHYMSMLSVFTKWFYKVDNLAIENDVKKIIKTRFANSFIYTLKRMGKLNMRELKLITQSIDKNILRHTHGVTCRIIYMITKLIGLRLTAKILYHLV